MLGDKLGDKLTIKGVRAPLFYLQHRGRAVQEGGDLHQLFPQRREAGNHPLFLCWAGHIGQRRHQTVHIPYQQILFRYFRRDGFSPIKR